MTEPTPQQIDDFIGRWQASGAAERANFPQFAVELCDLIGVPRPEPSQALEADNSYVFEKSVPHKPGHPPSPSKSNPSALPWLPSPPPSSLRTLLAYTAVAPPTASSKSAISYRH